MESLEIAVASPMTSTVHGRSLEKETRGSIVSVVGWKPYQIVNHAAPEIVLLRCQKLLGLMVIGDW